MRVLWDEYAGTVLGTAAAAVIIGMMMNLLVQGGILYEAIRRFAEGMC